VAGIEDADHALRCHADRQGAITLVQAYSADSPSCSLRASRFGIATLL
jgi:hypothetical protein